MSNQVCQGNKVTMSRDYLLLLLQCSLSCLAELFFLFSLHGHCPFFTVSHTAKMVMTVISVSHQAIKLVQSRCSGSPLPGTSPAGAVLVPPSMHPLPLHKLSCSSATCCKAQAGLNYVKLSAGTHNMSIAPPLPTQFA